MRTTVGAGGGGEGAKNCSDLDEPQNLNLAQRLTFLQNVAPQVTSLTYEVFKNVKDLFQKSLRALNVIEIYIPD